MSRFTQLRIASCKEFEEDKIIPALIDLNEIQATFPSTETDYTTISMKNGDAYWVDIDFERLVDIITANME